MSARTGVRCDRTAAWKQLRAHYDELGARFDVRTAFEADGDARFAAFSEAAPHVFADLSKNLIDRRTEELLLALARESGLEAHRDAMFAGQPINRTEDRAVMHFLLRAPADVTVAEHNKAALADVHATLDAMLAYAEQLRGDHTITDVVNIGIGGSDLGPQMVVRALDAFTAPGKRFHFVSNVDGHELAGVLKGLAPEHTLFLIASKTFTTAETMTNAQSAKRWFAQSGGVDVARHFAALTTNVEAARAFGIEKTFGFWDWVGGRYSLWSAIGLPIALAIGADGFRALLAGAHAMDEHFRTAPLAQNLPVRLGLLDVWYRNFHGFTSRSIAPYHSALARLPAYLQQLEMESNGKQVDASGEALSFGTSPVLWGEPGTNGQHAYFQMLHQGTDVIPLEFVAVRDATHELEGHHPKLLANALAQAQALMAGQADAGGHKNFPGNRPSTFFVLDKLTPESLGAFLAMYEHRVFTSGALWGINSFDQWGVELGKVLARDIEPRLASGDTQGLDASTAGLIARLR
ncbi:glucose-6-phosphate isomerase [Variovorax guangxiensis]|uniref:Glucose-6-phosphate isomerase n=1 Tax=Variovorax guangxiensis TaxID=1775474 RepID=A0A502DWJ8_9BURK|nr:glucose-6-phosphate isomerase [Variovorax guangxiensis]TPG24290.1 glucose-6-phosphate isomerase [Variovorax ginsengisoli]TPG28540.1 glucose-6-phosphate isomerase [Variovorax guangxiensis]